MVSYTPKIVTEDDVRSFFTPPLDYDDVDTAELLLKIEAVEDYVTAVYFDGETPSKSDARIPVLLLIASKIVQSPRLAKKYCTLSREVLGDYQYELPRPVARGTDVQTSPFIIAKTWEKMAIEMLLSRSESKWKIYKANG